MKIPGTIQVDMDSLWAIRECYGWDALSEESCQQLYREGTEKFLDAFDEAGVKGTFFVIGKDALDPHKQPVLEKIKNHGHEIANHSHSHILGLTEKSENEIEDEIVTAEKAIIAACGIKTTGFRSPGYDINEKVLNVAEKLGYNYDSSVLPSFYGFMFRIADRIISRNNSPKKNQFGCFKDGFAPLKPYYPEKNNYRKKGGGKREIIEVPVSTIPLFRLPFHTTVIFKLGIPLFKFGLQMLYTNKTPVNYVFHLIDMVDVEKIGGLEKLFFLKNSAKKRQNIVKIILNSLALKYEILRTCDFAERLKL